MRSKPMMLVLATLLLATLALAAVITLAGAQQPQTQSPSGGALRDGNPRLADLMEAAQLRHIKLWFAGKASNWKLAAYQTRQIKARLQDAASMYERLPVNDLTTMAKPLAAVAAAITAEDGKAFAKAYGELTTACNSCHQTVKLEFIELKTPTGNPFGDQVFGAGKGK